MLMVKKILLSLILLPFLILLFAPKKELYYLLEQRLKPQGIVIADEAVHETPIGLTLEHPVLYVKGVRVATARELSLWSLLLYGRGVADHVRFDPAFERYAPASVARGTLTFSILHPIRISIALNDPAFEAAGEVNLKERTLSLRLSRLPGNSPLKPYLKHGKGGWVYETNY